MAYTHVIKREKYIAYSFGCFVRKVDFKESSKPAHLELNRRTKRAILGWYDGSVVKRTYCFCRGHGSIPSIQATLLTLPVT